MTLQQKKRTIQRIALGIFAVGLLGLSVTAIMYGGVTKSPIVVGLGFGMGGCALWEAITNRPGAFL